VFLTKSACFSSKARLCGCFSAKARLCGCFSSCAGVSHQKRVCAGVSQQKRVCAGVSGCAERRCLHSSIPMLPRSSALLRSLARPSLARHCGLSSAAQVKNAVNTIQFPMNFISDNFSSEAHPGIRLFTIKQNKDGGFLNSLDILKNRIPNIEANHTVGVIMVKVDELDLLSSSKPYGNNQSSKEFQEALKLVNEIPSSFKGSKKQTVVIFDGKVTNSGFSLFYDSKVACYFGKCHLLLPIY
jgi:hypothetical protein